MKHRLVLRLGLLCLFSAAAVAQSPFAPKVTGPLSKRVVAYQIDAKYDPPKHTVEATETLTYHNLTGQPLDTFPFHLYLNGFQPKSTWMHEAHRDGNFRSSSLEEWKDVRLRVQRGNVVRSRRHGRPHQADEVHFARRRQSRRQDRLPGEAAAAGCLPARTSPSRSSSRRRFRKSSRAPATSVPFSSPDNGFPRSACGGKVSGIAISFMP